MGNLKVYFILLAIAALAFTGCKKDNSDPIITSFLVNGVEKTLVNSASNGEHMQGTDVSFQITATDEGSLGFYQVSKELPLPLETRASGELEGTSATINHTFSIDPTLYPVGQEIKLSFIIEDARGSIVTSQYTIVVDTP